MVETAANAATDMTSDDYLSMADEALSQQQNEKAVGLYLQGIDALTEDESLLTELSLYTNLGTAYSSMGHDDKAATYYQTACKTFTNKHDDLVDPAFLEDASKITAQASFFWGMVLQDAEKFEDAVAAYAQAYKLDHYHWAAVANMAAVFHDSFSKHDDALTAYNQAYEILTQQKVPPTDPPAEPRYILSQLQYRIGLCLHHDLDRNCAMEDDPETPVSCKELATHAFARALEYDPDNEPARHMLATITADATMKKASNAYVKSLFDDYAQNFEHSLVKELSYTGYQRLRLAFDRAFQQQSPSFARVIDAGCGTGLVGEQFRNVSDYLVGVDLSEAILVEAQKARPGLYDKVVVGDVAQVIQDLQPVNLIIAADSYIYFGDLDPLFDAMEAGLANNGYAAFTLENVDAENEQILKESKPDWRWQLTASGRFAHRKEYVLDVARAHHLGLVLYEELDGFRYEKGVGVRGHIFIMQMSKQDKEL